MAHGGARELRLPDWPFGAVGRRLLLEALLLDDDVPEGGWTKNALETRARVCAGGLDEVLAGALQLKLVEHRGSRWHRPEAAPPLATPLSAMVRAAQLLPNAPIKPIPRRAYRRKT